MTAQPTFSTHDLRSHTVDLKRQQEHKHKWALGEVEARDNRIKPVRPFQVVGNLRLEYRKEVNRLRHRGKVAMDHDIVSELQPGRAHPYDGSSSSAEDDDIVEASAAGEPDADVTYTYDHVTGPRDGTEVLSLAVSKAVERFENVQTEQLVKAEYEMLDSEGESVARVGRGKAKKAPVTDDDDFELV